jgi:hydroxymethylpyrimidine pyrophosphatase-like HAD family hydrolase
VATAIQRISASGVHVVLATGRSPWRGVAGLMTRLGLVGPQITMQGALLSDPITGRVERSRPMSSTLFRAALWFADELGIDPIVSLIDGHRIERLPADGSLFETQAVDGRDFRYVTGLERLADDEPMRVFLPTGPERHLAVRRAAIERFDGMASIVWSDLTGIDILTPGTDKGEALAWLAASKRIGLDRVAAVGDAPNDAQMLRRAGRSAAMDPAPPDVRSCADITVPSSERLGVLHAFAWFFPDLADSFALGRQSSSPKAAFTFSEFK